MLKEWHCYILFYNTRRTGKKLSECEHTKSCHQRPKPAPVTKSRLLRCACLSEGEQASNPLRQRARLFDSSGIVALGWAGGSKQSETIHAIRNSRCRWWSCAWDHFARRGGNRDDALLHVIRSSAWQDILEPQLSSHLDLTHPQRDQTTKPTSREDEVNRYVDDV